MCQMCGDDEKSKRDYREGLRDRAVQLRGLANRIENYADGKILPHTQEARNLAIVATNAVKFLVEDWL